MQARAFAAWRRARQEAKGLSALNQGEAEPRLPGELLAPTQGAPHSASGAILLAACQLGTRERSYLELMAERYQLSGRGIMCALSVARTIADIEESERVHQDHLLEAVSFRKNDRESSAT